MSAKVSRAVTGVRRAEISGTVIRADGTVEELGVLTATDFLPPSRFPPPAIAIATAAIGGALLLRRLTRP